MNLKMRRVALALFCISACLLLNCSETQSLIEISEGIKLKDVGQELIGEESGFGFGQRVGINEMGNTLVVSARKAGRGKAFVYQLKYGTWSQLGKSLECNSCSSFGSALDISDDGKTVAIGSDSEGIYVYRYKWGDWTLKGEPILSENYSLGIGKTLELSGDGNRIAFTAPYADSKEGIIDVGATYVLEFKDDKWKQKGNVIFGDRAGHQMGYGMSYSRNGDRIVISSPQHNYRYTRSYQLVGNSWKQTEGDINPKEKQDGWRIKINDEGSKILSSNGNNKIYLYSLENENWEKVILLEGDTEFAQDYGFAFEFVPQSSLLVVSDPSSEDSNGGCGELYFYDLGKENNYEPVGLLKGTDNENCLGYHLDVSSDGNRLVVGSMGIGDIGLGSVRVYEIISN